ncbi:MAG: diacylglycerol kinase family protein [Bacillota bacterium]
MKQQSLSKSLSCAWQGIRMTITTQRNMRIHLVVSILVLAAALALHLKAGEIIILLLTIGMVIISEIINTAAEWMVDLVTSEYHPLAELAKNAAAGAVLVSVVIAVIVGVLVFYHPLIVLFGL